MIRTKSYIGKKLIGNLCHTMKLIVCMIICLLLFKTGIAQPAKDSLARAIIPVTIHAKSYGDSIVLRWAPTSAVGWSMTRGKGYTLYRITQNATGDYDTLRLNKTPILPQTLAQMKATANREDKYMALVAQAMYGNNFDMSNPDDAPKSEIERIRSANDMFTMRYYFSLQAADLSRDAATALGLRWVDRDVQVGGLYHYFIKSDTVDMNYAVTGGIIAILNRDDAPAPPHGLQAFAGDKRVELHWDRNQMGEYTVYYIERSDDGGKTFKRLNKDPFQSIYNPEGNNSADSIERYVTDVLKDAHVFFDSIPQNYHDYQYRLIGIDAFADWSNPSAIVTVQGVDKTPPPPARIDSVINVFQNQMAITWTDNDTTGDVVGYFVNRGTDAAGPFYPLHQDMLDRGTRTFIDSTANALQPNYYTVVSVDTAHNYSYSIPRKGILIDSIAPEPPVVVKGLMDTLGFVALYWQKSPEPDVVGYNVYMSYLENGKFLIITDSLLKENFYIDSISVHSRDRKVYYKVVAVDKNRNHSAFSKPILVYKPILVPPTAPVNKQIYTEGNAVRTEWIGSQSEGVWGYEVYRRENEQAAWDTIAYIPREQDVDFVWVDSTIQANIKYSYAASTVDSTGLRSDTSFPVWTMLYNSHTLPRPTELNAQYLADGRAVAIRWKAEPMEDDCFYILYRAEGDGALRTLSSVDQGKTAFNDRNIQKGVTYRYAIEVRKPGGILRSGKSKEVSITVP